jgi:dihydropteroate synthase
MLTLRSNGKLLNLDKPKVMGILNCNQDSFYAASRSDTEATTKDLIDGMVRSGAAIIDIGGMSTKPGSKNISADQEISRIGYAITYLKDQYPDIWISVDTVQSSVASYAIEAGADMINDVSGGLMDQNILNVVGSYDIPYVCTHMKGTPDNMQDNPHYENVIQEVSHYFEGRIAACSAAGIGQLILDPGFGFGKAIEHNYQILDQLESLHSFNKPLLAGFSRKSMIYKLLGTAPEDALNGTSILNTIALLKGVQLLRVHDVKEAVEAVTLFEKMRNA